MTDMSMILHFLFSGVATAGFAVFFNAPLYLLLPAGVTGGIGWIVYVYLFNFTTNAVLQVLSLLLWSQRAVRL